MAPSADAHCTLHPTLPFDLMGTLRWLRAGHRDPTVQRGADRHRRALVTEDGVATVELRADGEAVVASAWGPGAEAALARVPALIGLADEPWALPSGHHPRLDELARRHPGLRLVNTGDVFEALLVTVPQQLVTWQEAVAGWRRLVEKAGSPAPLGLIASPTAAQVRRLSLHDVVGCGIARRRAETILRCARVAGRLQQAASMPTPAAMERLMAVPGVGPWTAASVLGQRLGRPDVIIEGDVHLPNTVAYGLTGQARADDPAMRRILAPYAGQEMRVVLLLMAGGVSAPKRGPRRAPGWR